MASEETCGLRVESMSSMWLHIGHVLSDTTPGRRAAARYPRQAAWVGQRFDASSRRGLPLTGLMLVAIAGFSAFVALTEDVVVPDGLAAQDPTVHAWAMSQRTGLLTAVMKPATWLGSNLVLVPVLVVVVVLLTRARRSWRPGAQVALTYGAAVVAHFLIARQVQRARPPVADWLTSASGWSYPSGHATQVTALGVAVLLVLWPQGSRRVRLTSAGVTSTAVVLVCLSRVYLGVHWLTDVLGGLTMSITLACLVAVAGILVESPQ